MSALPVHCPTCDAEPWEHCIDQRDGRSQNIHPHRNRIREFRAWIEELNNDPGAGEPILFRMPFMTAFDRAAYSASLPFDQ